VKSARSRCHGDGFPSEIISYAVWVYHRFCLASAMSRIFSPSGHHRLLMKRFDCGVRSSVLSILVQPRRDQRAAERFFRRLFHSQGKNPLRIMIDKLRSYSAIHANDSMRCDSPHGILRQQPRRRLASADPPEGTTHAPIQICWTGSMLSLPHGFVHNPFRVVATCSDRRITDSYDRAPSGSGGR